ncbi:MAG: hypothetical protein ABR920_11945 [Terriglobales bacterium]
MNIAEEARRVLERAGYRIFSEDSNTLQLEDDTLIGFVTVCQSGEEIVNVWRERQATFLRKHAVSLRASGMKSWNVYSVFLSASSAYSQTKHQLLNIEEDFQSTRKIAQSNLLSSADVVRALLPLIPIQSLMLLRHDEPISRLRARIGDKIITTLQNVKSADELTSLFLNMP